MSRERNDLRAGLFVLFGLILAFALVIFISNTDRWFTPMQKVRVSYHISDGLRGLQVGAPVTVGDVPSGQVIAIRDVETDGVVTHQIATFTLPEKYKLYDNAAIQLKQPPLGSNTKLNIQSFGSDGGPGRKIGEDWAYQPGEILDGEIAGSHLTASAIKDLGIGAKQKEQIRAIIDDVKAITGQVRGMEPGQLASLIANLSHVSAQFRGDEKGPLRDTVDNLATSTSDIRRIMGVLVSGVDQDPDAVRQLLPKLGRASADIQAVTAALSGGVAGDKDVFKDLLANLKKAAKDIADITDKVRQTYLAKIESALDKANTAMDDVKHATSNVKTLLTSQRPVLERTLANARLVSDQLKLASIEIRRSPWRLLYKPDEKELNTDNIYDAARSFALAAGTLDNIAESLRTLMDRHGDQIDPDNENVQVMIQNLNDTFSKYTEAEKKFWQALSELEDQ